MLNINAKAFVPGGATGNLSQNLENGPYRYRINVPSKKRIELSLDAKSLSNVSALLNSKQLFSIRDPMTEDELIYYVKSMVLPAENVSDENCSGVLLSRPLLANYLTGTNNTVSEAVGALIHLDVPTERFGSVSLHLSTAWDAFFSFAMMNESTLAFGYVFSSVGQQERETFRHYFFMALSPGGESTMLNSLSQLSVPMRQISLISSIVPFLCGPKAPLCVAVTMGKEAAEAVSKDSEQVDLFLELEYSRCDLVSTHTNLEKIEEILSENLRKKWSWDRTIVVHLNLKVTVGSGHIVPVGDVIGRIASFCDNIGACVVGVSFSEEKCYPDVEYLLSHNRDGPFFVRASLTEMLSRGSVLGINGTEFGQVPQYFKRTLNTETAWAAMDAMNNVLDETYSNEQILSRMNFSDAADFFAKETVLYRRRATGASILLGTGPQGEMFCVDVESSSVFALPQNIDGMHERIPNCIFRATFSSSFYGKLEYRIIIHDVLLFHGEDVRNQSFFSRWGLLDQVEFDEENSWPHATQHHLVIGKASYTKCNPQDQIGQGFRGDHLSLGYVFVSGDSKTINSKSSTNSFSWVPPSSVTAVFFAEKVTITPESTDLRRVYLSCLRDAADGALESFSGEYADFLADAYPDLHDGVAVECILRRAEDGAHWWDVLRCVDTKMVFTTATVDVLVHSPAISLSELNWLLTACNYQCSRCHKVNDVGGVNTRQNAYWCESCWSETGHGNCMYCGRSCSLGMMDGTSQLFYCEQCWKDFSSTNKQAEVGYHVPPPPNATFSTQVMTRCVSLLIDLINPKSPSNDVIDLCCGGSVLRKWMRNKSTRYVGIDVKSSVVRAMETTIEAQGGELPRNASYSAICADAFSYDFWTDCITKIHPRQFHVVTCFAGMHHAFVDEDKARHFVGSVANALVPGGTFIGTFTDSSFLFSKGKQYSNGIMRVEWSDNNVPRIGHHFQITVENETPRVMNVIPIDFLIAVAHEYHLQVIPEAYQTLRELIEKDVTWTKSLSSDEKEYLCSLRTFAFKKSSVEQLVSEMKK